MRLIINADDFGRSESGDRTIIMLHKLGVVSSTTIMANGNNFIQAISLLKENPQLGTGVHLCLDGPYNIGQHYYSIMDKKTNNFYNNFQIINKLKRFSVNELEMFKEFCLQIEKVLDYNINISHLDSHHHLHMYLPALTSMIRAAKKYNIRYIRSQRVFLRNNQNLSNWIYRYAHQLYLNSRIKSVDGFYEPKIHGVTDNDQEYSRLLKLLNIKNSIFEIILHPINEYNPETIFFRSQKILDQLSKFEIINYQDLIKSKSLPSNKCKN